MKIPVAKKEFVYWAHTPHTRDINKISSNCARRIMNEHVHSPPAWFYKTGTHPPSDDRYFENLTRVIFQAGLNWNVIEKKWSNFRAAFERFSIEKVAKFNDDAIKRLMADEGIIRNRRKILATIHNAAQFKTIKEEFGSFQAFISTLDKSNNCISVIKRLSKKFQHLGPSSARIFLYSVGEKLKHEHTR